MGHINILELKPAGSGSQQYGCSPPQVLRQSAFLCLLHGLLHLISPPYSHWHFLLLQVARHGWTPSGHQRWQWPFFISHFHCPFSGAGLSFSFLQWVPGAGHVGSTSLHHHLPFVWLHLIWTLSPPGVTGGFPPFFSSSQWRSQTHWPSLLKKQSQKPCSTDGFAESLHLHFGSMVGHLAPFPPFHVEPLHLTLPWMPGAFLHFKAHFFGGLPLQAQSPPKWKIFRLSL